MFHNYFYLKRLAPALDKQLNSIRLVECFSQNKDELILGFAGEEDFYIKAALIPEICLLQFPEDFKKANKNYVDLFPELIGLSVKSVEVFPYERSFKICLEDNIDLIFKMHGSRSNILISKKERITDVFKKQLRNDFKIDPAKDLTRDITPDKNRFNEMKGDLRSFLPALGKEAVEYLRQNKYSKQSMDTRWEMLEALLHQLENNPIWIYQDNKVKLSLLKPAEGIFLETTDPILAANELYRRFTFDHYLSSEKATALKQLDRAIEKAQHFIEKSSRKLEEVKTRRNYEEVANLIMANLHQIDQGTRVARLMDFYNDREIEIKLKETLTPQKNAEQFYRKAKNQKKEIEVLEKNIRRKETELHEELEKKKLIEDTEDIKLIRRQAPVLAGKKEEKAEPFFRFHHMGYEILIGKNARQNDELTLRYATKNDLWLHAKDVAGSHVVIKTHPGENYPEPVIERAAELAAWYSKRKTDSLCPVIYTPKKFVRKRKGDPPGAVVVEREEIIMVRPRGI